MSEAPIKEFKYGQKGDYVKAAIWENTSGKGMVYHTVKLSRHYYHENEWHETQFLYAKHLPLGNLANGKAHEFIYERLNELREQQKAEETEKSAPATKRGRRKTHVEKLEEGKQTAKGK